METLAVDRHPEGLITPLIDRDWKTALTVILHSPFYTKRFDEFLGCSPLHVAIRKGAPVEVLTALLEAYPASSTVQTVYSNCLPCHEACRYGISSEGMKMLLRCHRDAVNQLDYDRRNPMQILKNCRWKFFVEEKEQVMRDLKQQQSYYEQPYRESNKDQFQSAFESKEQQALLQSAFEETDRRRSVRRSVAKIVLSRQLDIYDLVPLIIEYL